MQTTLLSSTILICCSAYSIYVIDWITDFGIMDTYHRTLQKKISRNTLYQMGKASNPIHSW
jgi:hypothetical protein